MKSIHVLSLGAVLICLTAYESLVSGFVHNGKRYLASTPGAASKTIDSSPPKTFEPLGVPPRPSRRLRPLFASPTSRASNRQKQLKRKAKAAKSTQLQKSSPTKIQANFNPKTEAQFTDLIKYYVKNESPRKVAELWEEAKEQGLLTSSMAAQLVQAELKMGKQVQALRLAEKRLDDLQKGDDGYFSLEVAGSIVKSFARLGQLDIALELAEEMGVFAKEIQFNSEEERKAYRAAADPAARRRGQVVPALALAAARAGRAGQAGGLVAMLARQDSHIDVKALNQLLAQLGKINALQNVFDVMDVFQNKNRTSPDDETFEFLANAAAKNIEFVTGSVSMETLPKTRLHEAAIIGKSNVGKSSLVNMICNRKNLAFTSKKPGKTQQFNYFKINSGSEHEFYLVDVPGLGYAKVPKHLRDQWVQFLTQYISERKGLKVLFHLIDSRHGPVETDVEIMGMARDHLAPGAQYVVVLTKADKKDGKVPRAVRDAVAAALEAEYGSGAPVVITSAESRLGRDAMWHHLKRATLG